jgi:hypothetical protein
MDAFERPRVSGPLTLRSRECGRAQTRTSTGELAAIAKSCIRFYVYDDAQETSRRRDFGVIWLQTNVNALRDWCTTWVRSVIQVPRRSKLHAHRPRTKRTSSRRRVRTRVVADGQGNAQRNAVVSRNYILYSRVLQSRVRADRRAFRNVWYGSSAEKLAFALGIELSWRAENGPPQSVSSGLDYRVRRRATC